MNPRLVESIAKRRRSIQQNEMKIKNGIFCSIQNVLKYLAHAARI